MASLPATGRVPAPRRCIISNITCDIIQGKVHMRSVINQAIAIAMVATTAVLGTATPARAENLDFTLVNKTGYTIEQIHVSASGRKSWEEDVMGRDALANGESVHIKFDRGEQDCLWDLKVTYEDDDEAVWDRLDLCELSKLTLHYDRAKDSTWADTQ